MLDKSDISQPTFLTWVRDVPSYIYCAMNGIPVILNLDRPNQVLHSENALSEWMSCSESILGICKEESFQFFCIVARTIYRMLPNYDVSIARQCAQLILDHSRQKPHTRWKYASCYFIDLICMAGFCCFREIQFIPDSIPFVRTQWLMLFASRYLRGAEFLFPIARMWAYREIVYFAMRNFRCHNSF